MEYTNLNESVKFFDNIYGSDRTPAPNSESMGWNSTIESEGQENVILAEGDYRFRVTRLERGWFNGSEKICACDKANLTLCVEAGPGNFVNVPCVLFLNTKLEWKLSEFFRCIGFKKKGEPFIMDWNHVPGATGVAHFKPKTYTGKDGSERVGNDVQYFIDADDAGENEAQDVVGQ